MIAGGADIVQLRGKTQEIEKLTELAAELHFITSKNDVPLIINDHAEIARWVALEGVHLGQDDMPIAKAREIAGRNLIVGKSTHSLEQAVAAQKEDADYIGFGPLFATPTKPDYPPIGLSAIRRVHDALRIDFLHWRNQIGESRFRHRRWRKTRRHRLRLAHSRPTFLNTPALAKAAVSLTSSFFILPSLLSHMSVLVVGSIALDTVKTPVEEHADLLGGSASYAALGASFFSPVKLVGIVGTDFPVAEFDFWKSRKIDTEGVQRVNGKTFRWSGEYSWDLNTRETRSVALNVFGKLSPQLAGIIS